MKNRSCPLCLKAIPIGATACSECGHLIAGWYRYVQKYGWLISPFLAVLLFWLGGLNERWKTNLEQNKYNNQVIISLKNELSQNYANVNDIQNILAKNLILPLVDFQFTAWEYARFGRANFIYQAETKDFVKLENCYFMLHILESKIHDREQYRLLHEGSSVREILDKDILSTLNGVQASISQAQEYLDRIHAWVVHGNSFSVDKGLVLENRE